MNLKLGREWDWVRSKRQIKNFWKIENSCLKKALNVILNSEFFLWKTKNLEDRSIQHKYYLTGFTYVQTKITILNPTINTNISMEFWLLSSNEILNYIKSVYFNWNETWNITQQNEIIISKCHELENIIFK